MTCPRLLACLLGLLISVSSHADGPEVPRLRFSLAWLFQANQALFTYAAEKGFFKAEGLEVQVDRGTGSQASIQRILAGSHDLGFTDIGTLVKYNAEHPEREMISVYVPEEGNPMAIMSLRGRGISKPKDLEGRKLGAPLFDGANQLFPAFARAGGLDLGKIQKITLDPSLREPMLVRGEVDAMTGYTTSGILSLQAIGVKRSDIVVLKYQDYGVEGFGNSVIVARDFMEKNPRTVAAFVRAVNAALKDSIAHPRACVESLRSRDPTVDVDIEYQRMDLVLKELQVTPYVQQNGLSAVDPGKLDRAISAIRSAFNLQAPVPADHVFTERFLPPRSERMPPPVGPLL